MSRIPPIGEVIGCVLIAVLIAVAIQALRAPIYGPVCDAKYPYPPGQFDQCMIRMHAGSLP
jgi:hypothetical protein